MSVKKQVRMVNKFEGYCVCGGFVAEGAGFIVRGYGLSAKFVLHHQDADCPLVILAKVANADTGPLFVELLTATDFYRDVDPETFPKVQRLLEEYPVPAAMNEWAVATMGEYWMACEKI